MSSLSGVILSTSLLVFITAFIISFIFNKKWISKIWLTYVVDIIVFGVFLVFNSRAFDVFLKAGLVYLFIIWLIVFFIFQAFLNLLIIGKPFIKGKETKPSSGILDDDFIK